MTRVYRVQKSRVERRCKAGHVIPAGTPYSYATPGFRGRTIYACADHPFRPSDLTANDLLSRYYSAVEGLEDALAAWDGAEVSSLIDDLEAAESDIQECTNEWESQLENMGVLSEGDTGQQIQERLDGASEWQVALIDARGQLEDLEEGFDPDDARNIVEECISSSQL